MAWNEPGGDNRDPWGGGKKNGSSPPDLDEILKDAKKKFDRFFQGGGNNKRGGDDSASGGSSGGVAGVLLLVLILFGGFGVWKSVYILDEQEQGVVLRFGQFHKIITPGLKFQPWLIDNVYIENVTQEKQYSSSGLMLTQDENIVEVPITVQYNIENGIQDYVLNVNNPTETLEQATDSAIRHVVGSSNLNNVISAGRELLRAEVEIRLQSYLDDYGTGINIIDVTLQEARPPDAVREAFDDVIAAAADKERLINQAEAYSNQILPQARGRAQRAIESAEAYKGELVARAEGEADRFTQLLTEYQRAPEVTRERLYIDAIEAIYGNTSKVMVDVEGGNNLLYLPLDRLSGGSAAGGIDAATLRQLVEDAINDINSLGPTTGNSETRSLR